MTTTVVCQHPRKLLAVDVTAVISKQGHLTSGEAPIRYERLVFCAHRCCEHVFEAIPA